MLPMELNQNAMKISRSLHGGNLSPRGIHYLDTFSVICSQNTRKNFFVIQSAIIPRRRFLFFSFRMA
jgi:hypothetical protein